ncbi:MAG: restriction endonuclease subunit S [Methylococcaceae bacterium]
MSEWQECKFSDLLVDESISYEIVQPGQHTEINAVPVIRVNNIKNNKIEIDDVLKVSSKIEEKYQRTRLEGGELLITVVGSIGECAIVPNHLKGWNVARAVSVARIKKNFDKRFIKYCFKLDDLKFQMYGNTNDTVQPTLNLSSLKNLVLNVPTLPEQQAIANIHNKIDLLHRQNKTLEAMAETLFRQWFIEEASENWEETPLSQIANFLNGLACQKHPPKNAIDKLPVLKIKELNSGISESSDWATSEIKPEYIIENGDVIFAWSASLMVKVWNGEKCILNQHLFKVTSTEYPKWFYLMWCKHHLDEFISISSSHATTMGHIKRGDLDAAMVLVPSDEELEIMSEKMTPILNKQIGIAKQIKTLEKLRDNLLPKLMSGEVRVRKND